MNRRAIVLLSALLCSVADRDDNSQNSEDKGSAKQDHEALLTTASGSHYRPADALRNSSSVEPEAEAYHRNEYRKRRRKHHRHGEELQRHVSNGKEGTEDRDNQQTDGTQHLTALDEAHAEKQSAKRSYQEHAQHQKDSSVELDEHQTTGSQKKKHSAELKPQAHAQHLEDSSDQKDWENELMGAFDMGKRTETEPRQQELKAEHRSMGRSRDNLEPSSIAEGTSNLGHETASPTSPKSSKMLEPTAETTAKSVLSKPHAIPDVGQTVFEPTADAFAKSALSKPHVISEAGRPVFGNIDFNGDGFIDGVEFQNAVANGLLK